MSMTLQQIYDSLIKQGMACDPRDTAEMDRFLQDVHEAYAQLSEGDKESFDLERLTNPYSDSRILYGDGEQVIKTIICGIDVEVQDLLLVDRLISKGQAIDLVLTHHPEGKALLGLNEVMSLQEDMLAKQGVPINIAQGVMTPRISEVKRAFLPYNVQRGIDTARLLQLPLMCMHTPADNQVQHFLEQRFAEEAPRTVGDIITILETIPEYQAAKKIGAGPIIICGDKQRRAGKILVDMTGGTSGSDKIYEQLARAGVGTIVGMHMGEAHRKEAEKNHLNVVIAGHMASDSLGMNLLLDTLTNQGIEIIAFSGLTRVQR